MKTLVCTKPGKFEYLTAQEPKPGPGQATIKIRRIGICGTDLHAFEGTQPYFEYPRILGHELSGELTTVDAPGFAIGEAVTFIPYFSCGGCIACRSGKSNACVNMKVCGVHQDGGMVEYLVVPSSSLIHGEGLSFNQLALVEPLAIAAHAVRRAALQPLEFALIIGAGPIGLGIMEVAGLYGGRVIAMDINETRLAFCRRHMKIQHTINPLKSDARAELLDITSGEWPTLVIDATGNARAIADGFNYMAHGGRYVLVGLQKNEVSFSHPEFHKREGTLMSSRNATKEDFDFVIRSISDGSIDVNKFITHTIPFANVREEFPGLLDPGRGVVKAVIDISI